MQKLEIDPNVMVDQPKAYSYQKHPIKSVARFATLPSRKTQGGQYLKQ